MFVSNLLWECIIKHCVPYGYEEVRISDLYYLCVHLIHGWYLTFAKPQNILYTFKCTSYQI